MLLPSPVTCGRCQSFHHADLGGVRSSARPFVAQFSFGSTCLTTCLPSTISTRKPWRSMSPFASKVTSIRMPGSFAALMVRPCRSRTVGGIAGELDDLLADQRCLADQRHRDGLALQLLQHPRTLFFVEIDEDSIGRGGLDLAD